MNRYPIVVSIGLVSLAACQTMATANDKPARITNPTAESRAALQQTVNQALNTDVTLAENALTNSSMLIIERHPPQTTEGRLATGRNMEMPIQFRLVVNDSECILIDTRNESRHLLQNTTCIAE